MYNVIIDIPKQENAEGEYEQHTDYSAIINISLTVPTTKPISYNHYSGGTKAMITRDTDEIADVVAAFSNYTDVTITVAEIQPIEN